MPEGRLAWLRRLAYLLCQDWHEADDLVQVTLTRLYMYWPRAARMDNIDAYARTILVRAFLGERRSPWFRRVLLPGSAQADGVAAGADLDVREALAAIVTVDGVAAVLENVYGGQRVCIPDWRGLRLSVMTAFVETPPPNPADVLTIARKLHPIGPDPAHWTTDLLR